MSKSNPSFLKKIKRLVIGRARDIKDKALFQHTSLIAFLAFVGLGGDCLTSSCYGPPEVFHVLKGHEYLGVFVALMITATIFIICAGYNLVNELFPEGGGGYYVAGKLLSPKLGMISGCALVLDYILVITISIATGTNSLFSLFPEKYLFLKTFCNFGIIAFLIVLNLRGVKESITFLLPIFCLFMITHIFAILYSLSVNFSDLPKIGAQSISSFQNTRAEIGFYGVLLLILKAFSMGAGTYTGIEAVSNGMPLLREPKVKTAKRTMTYMSFSLAFMVLGLMISFNIYNATHSPNKTLNAVLYESMTKDWNTWGPPFVFIILISEAFLLYVASQTGFLSGPRVLSNMANDKWFPTGFAMLSDRLVTQKGILLMGISATIMMIISNQSVNFLIILFSINVFITFTLAQLGMVIHWYNDRKNDRWIKNFIINGTSFIVCAFILITVIILKFHEGGWITLFITGLLVLLAIYVKKHYRRTAKKLEKLEVLILNGDIKMKEILKHIPKRAQEVKDINKTAVFLVSGYNGSGISTLLSALKLFDANFKTIFFVEIGILNTDTFKSEKVIHHMDEEIKSELKHYVHLVERHGFEGKAIRTIGTDVSAEALKVAATILEKYPNCIFFGGQLLFPKDSILTRYLHNFAAFSLQKNFYEKGLPFIVLPIDITKSSSL